MADNEKTLCLTQIEYLEEQLDRYHLKCDELEKRNKELSSQCAALEKEERDMSGYLTRSAAENEKKVDKLLKQLESEQLAAEQDREALCAQHGQRKLKLQEQINTLHSQSMAQAAQIGEQKEQLMQMVQQLQHTECLEKDLANQKEEHKAATHSMQMDTAKIIGAMDDLLQMRIRDAVLKEETQHSEHEKRLLFLHEEGIRLQEVKDTTFRKIQELGVQRDNLKIDLQKATREGITYKKKLQQLSGNCSQWKVELKNCIIAHQQTVANTEELRKQKVNQLLKKREKEDEADQLAAKIKKERSRQRHLEGVMDEAAIILKYIMSESDKSEETKWMVQRLLEILESVAPR